MTGNPALIWGARRISWDRLWEYGLTVIGHLKAQGLRAGDRVAICAPASPEYVIALFALWRMGISACPVNPAWPGQAVAEYLSRVRAALVLTSVQMKGAWPALAVRTLFLEDIVGFDARHDSSRDKLAWQPDNAQEVTVIATSGSSGEPKPAVHTWGNHFYNAAGSHTVMPLGPQDRWLLALPLFHVSGIAILVRCYIAGAAIVLPVEEDLAETILRRRPSHVSLVAAQAYRLLRTDRGEEALKALRYVLLGGSAIPPAVTEQLQARGVNVFISYGLTEMASQVATGKPGGCIRVLPHREMTVSGDGEILVRGPVLFKGYLKAGRVQLPLTPEGWFATGDLGRLDDQGCLTVLGRKDNMFISGGENVHPEEIERVLLGIPGVDAAVVVPRDDPEFGQRPEAFVRFSGTAVSQEELSRRCAQSLPRYKVPRVFHSWPAGLPDQGIKVSRKELRSRPS